MLLWTHLAPSWPGVLGKADWLLLVGVPHSTVADVVEGSQICLRIGAEPRTLSPGKAGHEIEVKKGRAQS